MARKVLIQIEVENVGAARRLEALREEIRRLNKEIKGAEIGTPVYNDLIARITDAKLEAAKLKEEQKALNREFKAAQVPKDSLAGLRIEYSKLTEQIRVLSATERQSAFGQSLIKNAAGVKREIDGIEQSLGRFTGNVGNYKSAFASLAQIVSGGLIGGGLVLTVNALSNSFTKGLTALQDYGKGLSRLSAITGVTGAALDDLEERARGLTTIQVGDSQIVNTAQQIFEAFTLVGSARPELLKDAAALEEVTKQAIILSKASGDDLTTSVEAITTTLGQFKLGAGDSVRIINELAAGSKLGASEIVDTTVALKKFGTTAAVANVSTAESIALIETLADRQLKGEEAGTQLRNILAKLAGADILPRKALIQLAQAGVDINTLKDTTQPLIVRLQELSKLQGNTAALTKTFGLENLAAAQIITQGLPKYQKLLEGVQGTNEAYKQAGIQADNAAQRFANLEAKGVNLLTNAFLGIEPAITAVVDLLSGLVDILGEAPEFVSDNAKELAALGFVLLAFTRTAQTAVASTTAMTASQLSWAVALRGASVAQAISTAATEAMTAAMNALPLIAIVAGVYAIAKAFETYENDASTAEKATRAVAEAQAEIAEETAKEVASVQRNIEILKSETTSKQARKKAIDDLTKAYPEYLKGIDLEKAGTGDLIALQDTLTKSIYRSAVARKAAQEDERLLTQIIENQTKADRLRTEGFTEGEKFRLGFARQAQRSAETEAKLLDIQNQRLEEQRVLTRQRFERLAPQETILVDPKSIKNIKALGDETTKTGAAVENTIEGLKAQIDSLNKELESTPIGSARFKEIQEEIGRLQNRLDAFSTKKARNEVEAQAGSIAALRSEISKLEKQIEATAPESPALAGLVKQLDEAKRKLDETERALLKSTFKALFGRELTAPTIQEGQQPTIEIIPELQPDAADALKADAQAIAKEIEASLRAIEFPVEIKPPTDAERQFEEQRRKGEEEANALRRKDEEKLSEERARRLKDAKDATISAAEITAGAVAEIDRNRLEQQTQLQIDKLDIETQARIAAAKGNETKIKAIEKDAQAKREAIEKDAAEKRRDIALKEGIINTALAVIKALPNFVLAGLALATGVAQQAVIRSQEFAEGGVVGVDEIIKRAQGAGVKAGIKPKRLQPGVIKERPNAPRTEKGDSILAYLAPGEMVLNRKQQGSIRSMFGQDAFALAGVPGESATRRGGLPGFASGGIVGIVPQNGFAQQTTTQSITVQAKAEFTPEQVAALGGTLGTIIGELVERGAFNGTLLGNDEANRMAERQAAMTQNRQG